MNLQPETKNKQITVKFQQSNSKLFLVFLFLVISYFTVFGFGLFVISSAQALEFSGYYENDLIGLVKKEGTPGIADFNKLRIKADHYFTDKFMLHVEPRYYLLAASEAMPLASANDLDQLKFDRAYFKLYSNAANLTLGKQRIAWGSGYIWNPTDIFNPFVLAFAVREEDTTNVTAVRVEAPLGEAGGLDAYIVGDKPWEQTAKGLRVKNTVGLFDLAASYVDQGTLGHQFGLDVGGDIIKDVGVHCELALKTTAEGGAFIQSVWGLEYTFDNGLGLNIEYYFNGRGAKNKADYDWAALSIGTLDQLAADYLYIGTTAIINEITTFKTSVLANLNDQSWMFYPVYSRNIAQNWDLNLEAMVLGGPDDSEFVPPAVWDPNGFGRSKMAQVKLTYNF
ncbi:MAG: hypothetical protein PHH14_04335 [Candidatus Margulisbacteria bacterium]|nr:hypothetical protein [Candidatus Margulisiibacteriota bacterium]